jgi:hypothetical protein
MLMIVIREWWKGLSVLRCLDVDFDLIIRFKDEVVLESRLEDG